MTRFLPPLRLVGATILRDGAMQSRSIAIADGRITRGPGLVYGGVQILKTDGLQNIPEQAFSLNLLWNQMHDRNRLFALEYPSRWCDVGRPEGIALAEGMLADV